MKQTKETNLISQFKKNIIDNNIIGVGDKIIVACSGGPDSVGLLYLLLGLQKELQLKLVVAHFNHKIRGNDSERDEKFVAELAKKLGLKFTSTRATKKIRNEQEARELRYKFLEKVRAEERAGLIAVGHNLNDLAETVLLNIIRGSGIRGLYSLQSKRDNIIRPLLFAEKKQILTYLKDEKISFRIDKTNKKLVYTRNIIRHKILPEILKLNPQALSAIARTSSLAEQTDQFLLGISEKIFLEISEKKENTTIINRKDFVALSPAVQSEIIRICARNFGVICDLSFRQVEEILNLINRNIGKKFKEISSRLKIEVKDGKIILSNIQRSSKLD